MEPTLVPLPTPPEDFLLTDEEIQRALALKREFLRNPKKIDALFERQVRILRELHQNPRLCKVLGYEDEWQFLRDPEVAEAMRIKVGSRSQLYRLLGLAEVDTKFPKLHILREPHLTKLTHTTVLRRLEALNSSEEKEAEEIIEEVRASTIEKLNSDPHPEVVIEGNIIKINGVAALRAHQFSPLTIRAISLLLHFSPPPRDEIRGREIVAWHDGTCEAVLELLTDDEDTIEHIQHRLHALRG